MDIMYMQVENNNSGRDVASCTVPVRTRASPSPAPAKIEMCTIFGMLHYCMLLVILSSGTHAALYNACKVSTEHPPGIL